MSGIWMISSGFPNSYWSIHWCSHHTVIFWVITNACYLPTKSRICLVTTLTQNTNLLTLIADLLSHYYYYVHNNFRKKREKRKEKREGVNYHWGVSTETWNHRCIHQIPEKETPIFRSTNHMSINIGMKKIHF